MAQLGLDSGYRKLVNNPQFLRYLKEELGLSEAELAIAVRQNAPNTIQLPIVLWHHGLINLEQLNSIFDWLAAAAIQSPS